MGTTSEPTNGALFAGFNRGPRARLLVELKRTQPQTAKELAARLGVSLNAVRHHLKELEAEGLVEYGRTHRGVGAPAYAYRLSQLADELFPRRYEETLIHLLERLVQHGGRSAAIGMLEGHYRDLATQLREQVGAAPPGERLAIVARALADAGYMAESQPAADEPGEEPEGARLRAHNCPIHAVAERFPEICEAESEFLAEMLDAEVHRRTHILDGCTACEYQVDFRVGESHPVQITRVDSSNERPDA